MYIVFIGKNFSQNFLRLNLGFRWVTLEAKTRIDVSELLALAKESEELNMFDICQWLNLEHLLLL
jgi:hypothetical protein